MVFAGHLAIALIRFAMSKMKFVTDFAVKTSARASVAACKIVAVRDNFVSAITTAGPDDATIFGVSCNAKHDQATETLSGDVDEFSRHGDPSNPRIALK